MAKIPDSLINAIAIQFFISRNREMDALSSTYHTTNNNIDKNWRDEIANWYALSEDEKTKLLNKSRKFIEDWCDRYNMHSNYLIDNWQEVYF